MLHKSICGNIERAVTMSKTLGLVGAINISKKGLMSPSRGLGGENRRPYCFGLCSCISFCQQWRC